MKPDIVFCHGPFLSGMSVVQRLFYLAPTLSHTLNPNHLILSTNIGDYSVGETLLKESASIIALCNPPAPANDSETAHPENKPDFLENAHARLKHISVPSLSNIFARSRTPSPEPALTPLPPPPVPRRMVILVVALKPHRKVWTLSARPGESVLNYVLLNGCPAIVVPVKPGAPLVAWDCLTLEQLWEVDLPPPPTNSDTNDGKDVRSASGRYEGICDVVFEYMDLCIDWARVITQDNGQSVQGAPEKIPGVDTQLQVPVTTNQDKATGIATGNSDAHAAREAVKDAMHLLVAAAIRSKSSKEARKEIDADRSGIAMWRIP